MTRDLTNTYLRQFGRLPGWPPGMGVRDWFHPLDPAWAAVNGELR